jgi:hypothetical protein
MSNEKTTIGNPGKTPVIPTIRSYGAVAGAKPQTPEVINLEIDEDDDFGSDPYNRTGSHCVLKIGDDA